MLDGKGKFILGSCCSIMVDILAWPHWTYSWSHARCSIRGGLLESADTFHFTSRTQQSCSWSLLTNVINGWHSDLPGEHVTQGRVRLRGSEGCLDFSIWANLLVHHGRVMSKQPFSSWDPVWLCSMLATLMSSQQNCTPPTLSGSMTNESIMVIICCTTYSHYNACTCRPVKVISL